MSLDPRIPNSRSEPTEFEQAEIHRLRPKQIPVVTIPDLHSCDPRALAVDLRRYGVTDSSGLLASSFQGVACALGDYFDRGDYGVQPYRLMKKLQNQDPERVKLLFGNHDLYHLAASPGELSCAAIPGLPSELRSDILENRIQMAWAERDVLYTHAGVCLRNFPRFIGASASEIAEILNGELRALAQRMNPRAPELNMLIIDSLPLFGSKGPLWARHDISNAAFRQVVGHTPQFQGINDDSNLRVKYVDAARVFLEKSEHHEERVRGRTLGRNTVFQQEGSPKPLRGRRLSE